MTRPPRAWKRSAARSLGAALVALLALGAQPASDDPLGRAIAEQLERAERNPTDPQVANDLGNLFALVGRLDEAESAYRRAVELAPDLATAHYNLGQLLIDRGENLAARRELKRVLSLVPEHAGAHYYLGVIYTRWGWQNAARRAYVRAFQLDPALADPRHNPDVVDNRQALAAQLLTWSREATTSGPTRVYLQADRIAKQAHLPEPPLEPVTDERQAPEQKGGGFARSYDAPPRPAETAAPRAPHELPQEPPATSAPRVLDSSSLGPRGSVNQAQPSSPGAHRGGRPSQGVPILTSPFVPRTDSTGRIEHRLRPVDASSVAVG